MENNIELKKHEGISTNNYIIFVSNYGDIISFKYNKKKKEWTNPIILRQSLNQGYAKIKLKCKYKMVSRLVAETWLDLPPDYLKKRYEVHHINGDPLDNRAENLFWVEKRYHKTIHSLKKIKRLDNEKKSIVNESIIDICNRDTQIIDALLKDIQKMVRNKYNYEIAFYSSNQDEREIKTKTNKLYFNLEGKVYELEI